MWKFVEKIKNYKSPMSARHFVGMPIELEWKDVPTGQAAIEDDRIMADGRPAHAWWCEIEMLRAHEKQLQKREHELMEKFRVLRIAEWAFTQDIVSGDVILRIKQLPLVLDKNPEYELLRNPGKFCSIVKGEMK